MAWRRSERRWLGRGRLHRKRKSEDTTGELRTVGASSSALAAQISQQSQLFVYDLNRARHDPLAFAQEQGLYIVVTQHTGSGQIHGTVFHDTDAGGTRDNASEPGVGVRVVYIDGNGNQTRDPGERFAVSGANDAYAITDLPAGDDSSVQSKPTEPVSLASAQYHGVPLACRQCCDGSTGKIPVAPTKSEMSVAAVISGLTEFYTVRIEPQPS